MMLEGQDKQWLDEVFEKVCHKMEWVREKSKDKIPADAANNGEHDDRSINVSGNMDDGICWWTNGFWGGLLWLMYEQTGDKRYAEIANISEDKLDEAFDIFYGLHHDVGFMWVPTSVTNYRLTGNEKSRKRALLAANMLAGRFNPVGEYIRAWNDIPNSDDDTRGWAIIDCMFNISLLYWATKETGDPRYKQIAMKHADTAMNAFIRPDGSVNHIVEFDPDNGGVVKTYGGQGYCEGSSWTRGQTWAIYGFTISYLHTGKQEYLDAAKRVAHYFIANIPENGIIPIDFRQPKEPAWEDSIAACVAACGFIEISKLVGEHEKDLYLGAALKMLKALDQSGRISYGEDCDCFVLNGSGAYNSPVKHIPYVYADFYFVEALSKLRGSDFQLW